MAVYGTSTAAARRRRPALHPPHSKRCWCCPGGCI
jgi:hypothetical protein